MDESVGHRHGFQLRGVEGIGSIQCEIDEDRWLVVGERDGLASLRFGGGDQRVGRHVTKRRFPFLGHADVPVLAERTAEVAADGAHGKDRRAR